MPRKAKGLQYFYHVTPENWLNKKILSPQKPLLMDEREPEIERICVAPTLTGCISSTGVCPNMRVYRTTEAVQGFIPHGVFDAKVTGERWLLSATEFEYLFSIEATIADQIIKNTRLVGSFNKRQMNKQIEEKKFIAKVVKQHYGYLGMK